jgi:hypothetical protein
LTVTANAVTKTFGQVPILSGFTSSPLANGETVGSVTETSAGQSGAAAPGVTYPITPSGATGGTFTPSNYTIAYVNGALTVTRLPDVIPPGNPFNGPVVTPGLNAPTGMPVVAIPLPSPELMTLIPPPMTPVAPVVVAIPVSTEKPVFSPEPAPVIAPVQTPPEIYVTPHRPPKQDRN